jgi:ADP-heptose:LPS heptosyltransferase
LKAEPTKQEAWRKALPAAPLHIGVAWSGNAKNDRNRPIPLSMLAPLIQSSGARWHVLHTEFREGDEELMRSLPALAHYPEPRDFSETAALASVMDMIISVDTSILHLAGALALPTWGLIPMVPSWRWMLNRSDTPWYPTMRLFRQSRFNDWSSVVATIADELRAVPRRAV